MEINIEEDYLFISLQNIKQLTPISQNVANYDGIDGFILQCQLDYIKPAITECVYDDLQTKYADETLTDNDIQIIKLIRHSLAWYVEGTYRVYNSFSQREAGMVQQVGDNYQPVGLNFVTKVQNDSITKAEAAKKRLIDYLCENSDLYKQCCKKEEIDSNYWFSSVARTVR